MHVLCNPFLCASLRSAQGIHILIFSQLGFLFESPRQAPCRTLLTPIAAGLDLLAPSLAPEFQGNGFTVCSLSVNREGGGQGLHLEKPLAFAALLCGSLPSQPGQGLSAALCCF